MIDKHLGRTKRLQTERKVLFLCNSPFVVTIFFAFEDASALLYLVMECLHSDCKQMLSQRGVLSEQQTVSLMADVALALEHLHSCGIVHRDLKPENLLLTSSGRCKLADFGLSHVSPKAAVSEEELARDPSIVGTPFYMAPETIRGKARGVEGATDWWSYGVMVYEFLTGFPPFQGLKVAEIYRSILTMSFVAPIGSLAVSAEAIDLLSRLLVPNPRQRLTASAAIMAHPFFRHVDWASHSCARPAGATATQCQPVPATGAGGVGGAVAAASGSTPAAASPTPSPRFGGGGSSTLQSLAAAGGRIPAGGGSGAPAAAGGGGGGSSDGGVAMSTSAFSAGDSGLSAASTLLADMQEGGLLSNIAPEANDAHLDNLVRLNDKAFNSHLHDRGAAEP